MASEAGLKSRWVIPALDSFGAVASIACAIHCALTPILATSLPLLGLEFLAWEGAEVALASLSSLLAAISLCLGVRRHRRYRILLLPLAGVAFLLLGRVSEDMSWGIDASACLGTGGLILASAHLLNRRLCRDCPSCPCISPSSRP